MTTDYRKLAQVIALTKRKLGPQTQAGSASASLVCKRKLGLGR